VIFFLWHAQELLFGHPVMPIWKVTERMLSLLAIPILFSFSRITKEMFTKAAVAGLVTALAIVGIIMLIAAGIRFTHSRDWHEFTYHALANPIHTGAIYLSFYLLFALFKLNDEYWMPGRNRLKMLIAVFFLFLLLLSASKLFIGLGIPLLAWHNRALIKKFSANHKTMVVIVVILIGMGMIPFIKRAQFLSHPNIEMVKSVNFKNCPEPNGLNLRLIFLRFGIEILKEQHAWLTGTGMNRSKTLLSQKITQSNMYIGTKDGTDTGYLHYNFHDQYMETLVKEGLPGMMLLLLILIIFAVQRTERLFAPTLFVWVIAAFFFTESVLQRQAGIVLFCLIYCAFFISESYVTRSNDR
jgi:hypothetical protein